MATRQSLIDAGYDPLTTAFLAERARQQLAQSWLLGNDPVPRIPGRINQKKPTR